MRTLVTCPVCSSDCHVYRNALANHDHGIVRCIGSKLPVINGKVASDWKDILYMKPGSSQVK